METMESIEYDREELPRLEEEHEEVYTPVPPKKVKHIFVKVVFLKLGEIDTVKEQFVADVFIQARWRDLSLDSSRDVKIDFKKYWNPKLIIQNLTDSTKDNKWNELRFGKSGDAYLVEMRRIKGTFTEKMELENFPFDSQDLSISVTSERSAKRVSIHEDTQDLSTINVSNFVDEQEWSLSDHVEGVTSVSRKEFTPSKNVEFPVLEVRCVATRRYMFFVWNIIIIMFIISALAFGTFAVDKKLPQNRLQLAFTLTLTGVAFRFVANQSLPKISYLTKLDKYILFCMVFNFLISAWHATISLVDDDTATEGRYDFWAFICFIVIYSAFQLIFFIVVLVRYLLNRRIIQEKLDVYNKKAVEILGHNWASSRRRTINRAESRISPIPLPF